MKATTASSVVPAVEGVRNELLALCLPYVLAFAACSATVFDVNETEPMPKADSAILRMASP